MPAKIRLTRQGRNKRPYYHIVIADSRAPRDGRYIERIGMYNPLTNPATIELDFDKALDWVQKGAQPSDTCRAILSYEGVLMKNHLLNGVKKGALTEKEAETRFNTWMKDNENKIQTRESKIKKELEDKEKQRLEVEKKINEARETALAKKIAEASEEQKEKETETATEETQEAKTESADKPKEETKEQQTDKKKEVEEPSDQKKEHKAEDKKEAEKPEDDKEQQKTEGKKESSEKVKAEKKETKTENNKEEGDKE